MYTRIIITNLLTFSVSGVAQNSAHRLPGTDGGHIVFHITPTSSQSSLLELIRQSRLIIDGTVGVVLPPINTSPNQTGPTVETHSVVTVNAVLAGAVPKSAANILLAQVGGHLGKWDVEAADDPLVATGERYILFLVPDDRKELPNTFYMPRYAVTGVWTGKIKVTNGVVTFAKPSSPELHTYDGISVNVFLQTVRETISHPFTNTQLPINLAPAR